MSNGMKIASWRAKPPHPSGSSAPILRTGQSRASTRRRMLREQHRPIPPARPRRAPRRLLGGASRRPRRARPRLLAGLALHGANALLMAGSSLGCSSSSSSGAGSAKASKSSASSSGSSSASTSGERGQHAGAHAARALGDGLALWRLGGPLGLGEDRHAVVVQVLEILERPAVGAAPARRGRPRDWRARRSRRCRRAGARRARGRRRRRRTSARGRAGGRCRRGRPRRSRDRARRRRSRSRAGRAGLQRLDEAVQPGAQDADQPLGLVELLVRLGLDALARGAADARAHLGDDVERALVLARRGLVVALGDGSASSVSSSVTRRPRAIRSSRPSAMSVRLVREPLRPARRRSSVKTSTAAPIAASTQTRAPPPEPGAAAAEEGRAAAASAAAHERAGSGGASAGSAWGRPAAGHGRSVGALARCALSSREGFDAIGSYSIVLDNETLMF